MSKVLLEVYPRGFLGAKSTRHQLRTPKASNEKLTTLSYRVLDDKADHRSFLGNHEVEDIYARFIRSPNAEGDFEFRERLFKVAFRAFGALSFTDWINAQYRNPVAGDNHAQFLEDTVRFLTTGRRNLHVSTWSKIIVITDDGDKIGAPSQVVKEYIKRNNGQLSVVDAIQDWCMQPNGIEDLVCTLHVLFGNIDA